MNRRTDRRTDTIPISISRVSVAVLMRDKYITLFTVNGRKTKIKIKRFQLSSINVHNIRAIA